MNQIKYLHFKKAGEYERSGEYSDALSNLINFRNASRGSLKRVVASNIDRVVFKAGRKAKELFASLNPEPLYEQDNNPNNYGAGDAVLEDQLFPTITLTTISSRIDRVEKTVRSILNQTVKSHSVNLYISEEPYLIDKGIHRKNESLVRMADLGINIYYVKNIGPYRKQLPIILQLRSGSAPLRTPIITIDDDVVYPQDIIERLTERLNKNDAVIAHRGRELKLEGGLFSSYKSFEAPKLQCSHLNMGTGKNGIAYRLGFFPTDPEDFVGPILAPTADDIWCKWVTAMYCIPTFILEPTAAYDPSLDFEEILPTDKTGLFHIYNAKGSNDVALANLEEFFSLRRIGVANLLVGNSND